MPEETELEDRLEAAAKVLVDALSFSVTRTINTGVDDADLQMPNVICTAVDTNEEHPKDSGNFFITLHVELNSNKTTTRAVHLADVATMRAVFMSDDIVQRLGAAVGDFGVQGIRARKKGRTIKENAHSHYIELEVLACDSTLGWPEATLTAITNLGNGEVALTWTRPTHPATMPADAVYQIYRDGEDTPIANVANDVLTYTDTTAGAGDHDYNVYLFYGD